MDSLSYWVIFPLIQVLIALIGGTAIAIYGNYVTKKMGGGILQKTIVFVSIMAFFLAAYTIFGLWGYFTKNDMIGAISHSIILLMSLGTLVLAYYLKKFADELKKMENGE